MKRFLVALTVLGLMWSAAMRAEGPDDMYVRVYRTIQQADELLSTGQRRTAYERYVEAQNALKALAVSNPDWHPSLVQFRLNYLAGKLAMFGTPPEPATPTAPPSSPSAETNQAPQTPVLEKPAAAPEVDNQVKALVEENRRLNSDKTTLEAKLREALSAQPATVDPRELAKAEERIRALQKENDLLKVTLQQEQTKAPAVPPAGADDTRKLLDDAKRKIQEQAQTIAALTQEKQVLESKLQKAAEAPAPAPAPAPVAVQPPPPVEAAPPAALSNTQMALLQAENEVLKKSVSDLEKRVRTQPAVGSSTTPSASAVSSDKASTRQIRKLEQERNDLQKKLDAANRALAKTRDKKGPAGQQLANQVASLQARLDALEAKKNPYTPEELALLKPQTTVAAQALPAETPTPAPTIPATAPTASAAPTTPATPKPARELPAGVGALMADAQRDFAQRRFDDAEKKYRQILSQDENNVVTLTHLAVLELDRNRLEEAEGFAKKALTQDPEDSKNLALLGIVKVRQKKFDEGLEPLSRSIKLNPNYALAQNFLGIVLVEKGQREAAETAFRKAIQLDPDYANAHHNLAYVYATQNPPFRELAKYHYQKALAGGEARNEELEKLIETKK